MRADVRRGADAEVATAPSARRAGQEPRARASSRGVVADEAARPLARFLLREIADAPPMFTPLSTRPRFAAVARPRLPALGARNRDRSRRASKLVCRVFAMIAQIVYFRIARAPVLKRMGWTEIGPARGRRVRPSFSAHLQAALDAAGKARHDIRHRLCKLGWMAALLPFCSAPRRSPSATSRANTSPSRRSTSPASTTESVRRGDVLKAGRSDRPARDAPTPRSRCATPRPRWRRLRADLANMQ